MVLRAHAKSLVAVSVSVALHTLIFAARAGNQPRPAEVLTTEVELEQPPTPPPAPAERQEQQPASSEPTTSTAPSPRAEAKSAAPAAAAGRTLTAPDDAPRAGEMADFSMVQGDQDAYSGGTTAAAREPQAGPAAPGPARSQAASAPAAPAASAPPKPDLARAARPVSLDWDCTHLFPADETAPDRAVVLLTVTVSPSGRPAAVAMQRDPGHGFASAARACAMAQRYLPALDRDGAAQTATTAPITVLFTR